MSNWQQIRTARTDITDYVIHLTRSWVDQPNGRKTVCKSFKRLKEIVRTGYLKPTHAPRVTVQKNCNNTIRGKYPAVCFTEQPLEQLPVTLDNMEGTMYQGYGIALHKVDLHNYGGRIAIYGDEEMYSDLSKERDYLWVRYRPIREDDPGYPNDFTWEREWRCRVQDEALTPWGRRLEGVPILLTDDFRRVAKRVAPQRWELREGKYPSFRIIVAKDEEVAELRRYINGLWIKPTARGYYTVYVEAVKRAQIISLEHVRRMLEAGVEKYKKIEWLAAPEKRHNIRPLVVKKKVLQKAG